MPRLAGPLALFTLCTLGALGTQGTQDTEPPKDRSPRRCGCSHACAPATFQGCGCGAIGCFPGGSRLRALARDTVAQRAAQGNVPSECVDGRAAGVFPCRGVALFSYVPLAALRSDASSGSNLWGFASLNDGREYAVYGLNTGTAVVDVTDASRPIVVGSVAGPTSIWREVKVYQVWSPATQRYRAYAFVVSEARTAGLQIIDLSDLPERVELAATFRGFDTSHTVTVANVDPGTGAANGGLLEPLLYVQGARTPTTGIMALGLSNPTAPTPLSTYTASYGHDIWTGVLRREQAAACRTGHDPCQIVVNWGGDAIRILDWTEPRRSPVVIAELTYPELGYAHSGWISSDGDFLFSMDELDERQTRANSRIRILDVRDFARPSLAAIWSGPTGAIEHNGYTKGSRYYVSHYERGLTILDVSDPTSPRESAVFDSYPASDNPEFHGAWGVYPYLPSGNLLLGNIDGAAGLFVLRETDPPVSAPRSPIQPALPATRSR